MKASILLVAFLKQVEGYRDEPYQDSGGVWTCGWGHTFPKGVKPSECTPELAEMWLEEDVQEAEMGAGWIIKVPLEQHEFDAVVSMVFNMGAGVLANSNTLAVLNKGNKNKFADMMLMWNKVRRDGKLVPIDGLTNRRKMERNIFLYGDYSGKL